MIKKRFKTFVEQTTPVAEHFKSMGMLRCINAERGIPDVWADTRALFADGEPPLPQARSDSCLRHVVTASENSTLYVFAFRGECVGAGLLSV